jgi:hypothetical protein
MSPQLNVTSKEIDKSACYQLPGEGSKSYERVYGAALSLSSSSAVPLPLKPSEKPGFTAPSYRPLS